MPETSPTASGPTQQAPFGSSPVSGPTPNRGYEAAATQRLGVAIKQLEQLIVLAGSTSEMGKDVMKAINMLSKHVPTGSVTPAAEKQAIERMQMQNTQNQMTQARMAQMGGGAQQAQPGMAA